MYKFVIATVNKYRMEKYVKACAVTAIGILGLSYFIFLISNVERDPLFQIYSNVYKFTNIMHIIVYTAIASVLYNYLLNIGSSSDNGDFTTKMWSANSLIFIAILCSSLFCLLCFNFVQLIYPLESNPFSMISIFNNIIVTALTICSITSLAFLITINRKSLKANLVVSYLLIVTVGIRIVNNSFSQLILLVGIIMIDVVLINVMKIKD